MVDVQRRAAAASPVDASHVIVTNRAKQALFNTFTALLKPGDEALIPAPYWVPRPSSVRLSHGSPVITQPYVGALKVTPDNLEAARTPSTRAILPCSPNNPTGLVHDQSELHTIVSWTMEHDIWIISDETYDDLDFRPVPAPGQVEPGVTDRLITVGTVSKSYAMTGWRVGWRSGPEKAVDAATAIQSHTTSNVSRITQAAARAALNGPDVTAGFRRRRGRPPVERRRYHRVVRCSRTSTAELRCRTGTTTPRTVDHGQDPQRLADDVLHLPPRALQPRRSPRPKVPSVHDRNAAPKVPDA
ncbi:aminotransferase class I/II-fold pyridoxal phosphate-dependent enzyme [Streptomyces endocoffeicus]|uniref:aminotransferase class I/II-fold pyridoxal phosphate-dependent enzyme n=1 Tax=Streptomyces endocoffeicus TaxID=2898945 RepID=UPI0022AA88CF|nr:aminotransferase class I/II-fold pyridoxal phosphate-dependent enzyme [Streptomyces endocoffeicus]